MVSKAGAALKGTSTFLRALELLGSLLILGITSYWLGVLTHRNAGIPTWMKAVEGMSGGAVIYTGFAVILTVFLGGLTFFAFLAVLLDILFVGAMVAIAVLTRGGTHSCPRRNAPSPIGPNNRTSCRLETAVFAVAIALALFFLISAALQVLLSRHHKKEKRYGPGPSNDYTSGSGKKQPFWKRKRGANRDAEELGTYGAGTTNGTTNDTKTKKPFWKRNKGTTRDAELGAAGAGAGGLIAEEKHHHHNNNGRTSHETGVTGTTAGSPGATYGGPNNRYSNEPTVPQTTHHHGHTEPTGGYQPYHQHGGLPSSPHAEVAHDPNPYTEVHHGGFPHAATRTEVPPTFGHGSYNAA
ncbi:MAG: hypothetical protein L6R39_006010 [Caloplaca ligustica]|nr:MAG: hypothetical protein L6R39_006010 [Caloplaca ligustica]